MKWDLEERTEDALVSYLRSKCGDMRVYAAWERDEPEYPCAVVHVGSTAPIVESADWHDARELAVTVAVMTEGAHLLDEDGAILVTARDRNAQARSQVMEALFVSDLVAQLVAQSVDAVAFSMAQFVSTERATEDRRLITTINGTIIAEPVTGN